MGDRETLEAFALRVLRELGRPNPESEGLWVCFANGCDVILIDEGASSQIVMPLSSADDAQRLERFWGGLADG